jgi:hypothetical protein
MSELLTRAELDGLADAVLQHRLEPKDLPAYVAGFGGSQSLRMLATQLQGEPITPETLAERLRLLPAGPVEQVLQPFQTCWKCQGTGSIHVAGQDEPCDVCQPSRL